MFPLYWLPGTQTLDPQYLPSVSTGGVGTVECNDGSLTVADSGGTVTLSGAGQLWAHFPASSDVDLDSHNITNAAAINAASITTPTLAATTVTGTSATYTGTVTVGSLTAPNINITNINGSAPGTLTSVVSPDGSLTTVMAGQVAKVALNRTLAGDLDLNTHNLVNVGTINGIAPGAGGAVSSVTCPDTSLIITPTSGAVAVKLNPAMNQAIDLGSHSINHVLSIGMGNGSLMPVPSNNHLRFVLTGTTTYGDLFDTQFNFPTIATILDYSTDAGGMGIQELADVGCSSVTCSGGVSCSNLQCTTINGAAYPPASSGGGGTLIKVTNVAFNNIFPSSVSDGTIINLGSLTDATITSSKNFCFSITQFNLQAYLAVSASSVAGPCGLYFASTDSAAYSPTLGNMIIFNLSGGAADSLTITGDLRYWGPSPPSALYMLVQPLSTAFNGGSGGFTSMSLTGFLECDNRTVGTY